MCDYQATHISHLNRHNQSIHDGIKYTCDLCDYQATTKSSLITHKKSIINLTNHQRFRHAGKSIHVVHVTIKQVIEEI